MGTKLSTTTAFHSLANNVEARNKYLEQKIRGLTLLQDGWLQQLPQALFSINSMPNTRTRLSPIQVYTGRTPMRPSDTTLVARRLRTTNKDVQSTLDTQLATQLECEEVTKMARDAERRLYNKHRTDPAWFDAIGPGSKVLVESKHVSMPFKSYTKPKWDAKFYGPFTVKAIVDRTTVELDLPPTSRVHRRFDISRLKPFFERKLRWTPPITSPHKADWVYDWHPPFKLPDWLRYPEDTIPEPDTDTEYKVRSILAHREDRDGIRYLVNWANYSIEESTWEKAENCENAKDLIQQYHDRVLRMTTYHAMGDMADLDYMALAAITSPRWDDYTYQIQKHHDYTQDFIYNSAIAELGEVGDNISITPRPHFDAATTALSTTRSTSSIRPQPAQPQPHGTGADYDDHRQHI
jgi:hypothetical protein